MLALVHILLAFWLGISPLVAQTAMFDAAPDGFNVYFHPDGALELGDQVSIVVYAPAGEDFQQKELRVSRLAGESHILLGSAKFEGVALNRFRAALEWIWDTSGMAPGNTRLSFTILPDQISWQQTITLRTARAESALVHWASAEIPCCVVHYFTGTRAERDLPKLLSAIEAQAVHANLNFQHALTQKIQINLIPRILGQGGFAGEELTISYPEQNYANTNLEMVLHHEIVHRLDAETNSGFRPTLFVEGLAVYLSGGHYQLEPIVVRAVVVEEEELGLPLPILAENFYDHQHEISYIQAGALVDYMVRTWGWEPFLAFYRSIEADKDGSESKAIDRALRTSFSLSLTELDDRFGVFLRSQPVIPDLRADIFLTVAFYDGLRTYQKQFDPSAYFQQVWLPEGKRMRERGIVGDFLRGPGEEINLELEGLLVDAGKLWQTGRFEQAWSKLWHLLKLEVGE